MDELRHEEYPHQCRWCGHQAPTYRALTLHVEGSHPVEHWEWLGQRVTHALMEVPARRNNHA